MDVVRLRELLRPQIVGLKDMETHDRLPLLCRRLGLPSPDFEGSKRDRMSATFDSTRDEALGLVALNYLDLFPPTAQLRNEIQDVLWNGTSPAIPKRYRRELAKLLSIDNLFVKIEAFNQLLEKLWVLGPDDEFAALLGLRDDSLRAAISQHVYRNPGDWTVEYLFEKLGAITCSDRRFAVFLEGLASSEVRPDESSQRWFVQVVNTALAPCGIELRETDNDGGYPVFALVHKEFVSAGRPKNLIFASPEKPDLRFKDAINNDIEIVSHPERYLVYDEPIGAEGILWSKLQNWWKSREGISDDELAKKSLYTRLKNSLPKGSPPQLFLFDSFYAGFGKAIPQLPALLPEVWLHWDPKAARERGRDALLRFRMDFLMLLPHGIRVVLEVDGKHHYANSDGNADPVRYGTMMLADRQLKLTGYEVFRFGADELQGENGRLTAKKFFNDLFRRYNVSPQR